MKRVVLPLSLVCLLAVASVHATDPTPPDPVVIIPDPPPPPQPAPARQPTKLAADQIYLVRANVACSLIDGTEGLVTITPLTGPATVRGKFTDGNGSAETRTLTDKYLWLVTATGTASGKTDLIITPPGGKPIRRCLDVNGGTPPTPVPPVPPTPTDPLTQALTAAYALDKDADRAASLDFLQQVYKGMAANVPTTLKTSGDASQWIKATVEKPTVGLTATQLVNLRKAIAAEMATAFGTTATTPINVTQLTSELSKIATALANVH